MHARRDSCSRPRWRAVAAGLALCALVPLADAPAQGTTKKDVKDDAPATLVTEMIPLTSADSGRVADTLKGMLGTPATGALYIEYYPLSNALVLRGRPDQVMEAKQILRVLGEGGAPTGPMRVLTLERGSAATLAEALQDLLTQMRANPVKVVRPAKPAGETPPELPKQAVPESKVARPGKGTAPITITAFGNRLIVVSEDAEALGMVVELFRLLQAPANVGDFEVFRLKYAAAPNVARVLDEAFNGGRKAKGDERVRVIADEATNILLVRASPLDTLTIRTLLTRALDTPGADDAAPRRLGDERKKK
jgi:type II secretory pathway component GspD/PulD (secretin)